MGCLTVERITCIRVCDTQGQLGLFFNSLILFSQKVLQVRKSQTQMPQRVSYCNRESKLQDQTRCYLMVITRNAT